MHFAAAAKAAGYSVQVVDAPRGAVFASSVGIFSWGFFFPVYVLDHPGAGAIVEVGIASRLFQSGPLVTRAHDKFVATLKYATRAIA